MISGVSMILALAIFPIAYVVLCARMKKAVPRPPYAAFFFLFGTVGGWSLALALSPSGVTASCVVALVTAAPLALLISAVLVSQQKERSIYQRVAQWAGFGYPALIASYAAVLLIFFRDT
jgi:hypothetical protein